MGRKLRLAQVGDTQPDLLPMEYGGTGEKTTADALLALNGVASSLIDQPGGIAGLDSNSKMSTSVVLGVISNGLAVTGPTSLAINQTQAYTITDYDVFTSYAVTAEVGSVSISGDTITYIAPGTPGPGGFKLNNKVFNIAISQPAISAPNITSPVNGAVNVSSTITVTTSAFTVNGGSDTHQWSDWQISTNNTFTNIISQSNNDTVNKTSWTSGVLSPATTYYLRVRYKGTTYGNSNWSSTVSFTTKTTFLPQNEEARLVSTDKINGDQFGWQMDISSDGSRVIVGAPSRSSQTTQEDNLYGNNYAGAAYVFRRTTSGWQQEQKLVYPDAPDDQQQFGTTVAISGDGSQAAVAIAFQGVTSILYLFSRSGSTWSYNTWLRPAISAYYGSMAMDDTGTRLVVGTSGRGEYYGTTVVIYTRSGSTWTQEVSLAPATPDLSTDRYFGASVDITPDGTRIAVGCSTKFWNNGGYSYYIYVFKRTGTSWAKETRIAASAPYDTNVIGVEVHLSSSGDRVLTTGYQPEGFASNNSIAVVFKRTGSTWAQETVLLASNMGNLQRYGITVALSSDGALATVCARNATTGKLVTYFFTRNNVTWSQVQTITTDFAPADYLMSHLNSTASKLMIALANSFVQVVA